MLKNMLRNQAFHRDSLEVISDWRLLTFCSVLFLRNTVFSSVQNVLRLGAPWHSSVIKKCLFIPLWPGKPSRSSARSAFIPVWPAELAACRAVT